MIPKPHGWRKRAMHFAKRVLLFCLVVIALFTWFQRSLMYPAGRTKNITVGDYSQTTGKFARASDIEIVSGSSQKIRGWFLQTRLNRSDRLVLFFHGNGGHRGRRSNWYELCRSIDVDILAIDYRGYGDSEGKPSERALAEDAVATWKYASNQLGYRSDQIVILGESLGGGVSVKLAAVVCQQDELPAGLVLVSTFSSMVDAARNHFPWLPVRLLLLDRYRSDLEIPHVSCPVLQFHGTNDSVIPLPLAQRLHGVTPEMSRNGVKKKLILFDGTDHNDLVDRNGAEVEAILRTWVRPQLKQE